MKGRALFLTMGLNFSIRVILNSSVEDVLGWKCCGLQGMNLEVLVENEGTELAGVSSEMELEGQDGSEGVNYFFPPGLHWLRPGEGLSFYCSFPDSRFSRFQHIIVRDHEGRSYRASITGRKEPSQPREPEEENGDGKRP